MRPSETQFGATRYINEHEHDRVVAALRADLAAARADKDAILKASVDVRDDMILRANIGTFDGDHDIQMSGGTWDRFCAAIDAALAGKME